MKQKNQKGFTLIELLVATIVGIILIIATESAVTSYLHTSQQGRDLVLANSYAEGKIESLRSAGYNGLNIGSTNVTSELPSELVPPRSATLSITSPSAGIKQLDLTITYNDQGSSKTYSYTSYVGELGVGQ